jgi:phosphoribosylaminoimidazole carboxylase (NCAIR synthetase)
LKIFLLKTLDYVEKKINVSPKPTIIKILQDRLKEKTFLNSIGIKNNRILLLKKKWIKKK